jgi:phosphoserine phosphatase RsbU/P
MAAVAESLFREELFERRHKLEDAARTPDAQPRLTELLREVDDALARMDAGAYGVCEVCRAPVERERLIADPLTSVCLGCLSPAQRRDLEDDLQLAARIQATLLPPRDFSSDGWRAAYHYEAAGVVSGDYLDLVSGPDESLYFMLGDVSGKGVAASLLMSQLHAMFRALIPSGLPVAQLVERASRVFCESTLPTHYATLVCGRAEPSGEIEVCNAGHLPPLVVRGDSVEEVAATGLPVGVFCNEQFTSTRLRLARGDALLLYTDGLTEALDTAGAEYGAGRVRALVRECAGRAPSSLVLSCVEDLSAFRAGAPRADDLTVLAVAREV